MRKIIIAVAAIGLMVSACGNKTNQGTGADSTAVATDSVSTEVVEQVENNAEANTEDPDSYVNRYLSEMLRIASEEKGDAVEFYMYALHDIDGDGKAEILAKDNDENFVAFAVGSGKPELLLLFDYRSSFVFYSGAVGYQGNCGTGCHMGEYAIVKNSRASNKYLIINAYNMNGDEVPEDCVYQKDGEDITAAEAEALFKPNGPMGKLSDFEPEWLDMPGAAG